MPDDHLAQLTALPAGSGFRQAEIARALVDVGLLRGFVSSRADRTLERAWTDPAFPVKPPSRTRDKDSFLRETAAIEGLPPSVVERSPRHTAFLFGARDLLNAVAAPADAYTVAFTGLYAGGLSQSEALLREGGFATMAQEARTMRRVFMAIVAGGIVAVILAMWLGVHAYIGTSALERRERANAALAAVTKEVSDADVTAVTGAGFTAAPWKANLPRLCERISLVPRLADPPRDTIEGFEGPRHYELCDRLAAARKEHAVAGSELASWIDTTMGLPMRLLPGLAMRNKEMHIEYTNEQTARALLGALTVYHLPLLFGVIGGTIYAVRRFNAKIIDSELHPRDWRHALLRIFMAFLLGGCIGLFFSPAGVQVAGAGKAAVTLSIAALAFLAGYSVEVVFRFFDALIGQALAVVAALGQGGAAGGR